jgi:hypothetical protein
LYDTIENIYREEGHPLIPKPDVNNLDFWKHIWPVLLSAASLSWTNNKAFQGHGRSPSPIQWKRFYSGKTGVSSNGHYNFWHVLDLFEGDAEGDVELINERKYFKTRIFEKLRKPLSKQNHDQLQADTRYMPRLSGDAGKPASASDVAHGMTATIVQVSCQSPVPSLRTCSPTSGSLLHSRSSSTIVSGYGQTMITSTCPMMASFPFPRIVSKIST